MRSRIYKILKEETSGPDLPAKPEHHLFSDEWLSKLNTDGEYVTLYHYGPSDLEYLDPEYFGKHSYTDTERWWGKKRVFFYTDLSQKERIVGGQLYEVKVKLSNLYPFNKDPLNLYDILVKEYGNENVPVRIQVVYITSYLEKMGYKGMLYKWEGNKIIAVIWDKVYGIKAIGAGPKLDRAMPPSDRIGYPIVDGLSTNPDLTYEEKIDAVVEVMVSSNYPKDYIEDYLKNIRR